MQQKHKMRNETAIIAMISVNDDTIQYKFINMAAISWIKRKTITHKQGHAFKITLLEVGQRKRYKRVLKTSCPCTNRWIWLRRSQPFSQLWVLLGRQQVVKNVRLITDYTPEHDDDEWLTTIMFWTFSPHPCKNRGGWTICLSQFSMLDLSDPISDILSTESHTLVSEIRLEFWWKIRKASGKA